nr:MAG TPA: long tail fiber, proximal subunit [Caudoviricetes sp.]
MSQKWFNGINLQQNQLENAVIQNLASDPSSGKAGQIYYNTADKGYKYYNGTAWVGISADAVKSIVAGNGLTSSGTDTVTISLGTPSSSGSGSNTFGSNGLTATSHTHQISLPDASTTAKGVIEIATDTEATTGTDTTRAINAKQLAAAKQDAIDSAKVTIQTSNGITGGSATAGNSFTLSGVDATTSAKGVVQLATDSDKTSTDKVVTAKQLETARTSASVTVTAGNGLGGGGTGNSMTILLGTPSTITQSTTNNVTPNSHTHALSFTEVPSPTASGNEISFVDTVSQGANGGITATKKTVRSASATQTGVVELATQDEVNTGTDTTRVVTAATLGKGKANGVASLDENSKIVSSQLPDYLLGQVMYGGNASAVATTTTVSPSDNLKAKKGITATSISIVNSATSATTDTYGWQDLEDVYFICQASGTFAGISFDTGDWIISTGAKWEKIDNTDAVKSVNGKTGAVTLTYADVNAVTTQNVEQTIQGAKRFVSTEAGEGEIVLHGPALSVNSGTTTGAAIYFGNADQDTAFSFSVGLTGGQISIGDNDIPVTFSCGGNPGSSGQVLTSQGGGATPKWTTLSYIQKSVQTITGNGTTTTFDIAHTLGADVLVQVYLTGQTIGSDTVDELVMVDTYTMNNKVKLAFATAPTISQTFKVVITG